MTTNDLSLTGEIDISTVPAIRAQLTQIIEAKPGETIRVDLAGVDFLDSTGLGILVGALRRARAAGGELVLVAPRTNVGKVFSITGLDKVFTIEAG